MLRRLFIHNYRCLDNFELQLDNRSSALLVGKNGSGKTAVRRVLEIFQSIARGSNQISRLIKRSDFSFGRTAEPIRLEIDVEIAHNYYKYTLSIDLNDGPPSDLRILGERLELNAEAVIDRDRNSTFFTGSDGGPGVNYSVPHNMPLLSIIEERSQEAPLRAFKLWLERMLILSPIPERIGDISKEHVEYPQVDVEDYAGWLASMLDSRPRLYGDFQTHLKEIFPDFDEIKFEPFGGDSKRLSVSFKDADSSADIHFADLSDGEKCQMIYAAIVVASSLRRPFLCFWDEPDNYLALSEVQHFVIALRRAFLEKGQFIATSHHPEAIRSFSEESTFLIYRKGHLGFSQVKLVSELNILGDLIEAITLGDEMP